MLRKLSLFYLTLLVVTSLLLLLGQALDDEATAVWVLLLAYVPAVFLFLTGPIWLAALLGRGASHLLRRLRAAA